MTERNNFTGSSSNSDIKNYWYYVEVGDKNGRDVFYRGRVTASNKSDAKKLVLQKFKGKNVRGVDIVTKKTW